MDVFVILALALLATSLGVLLVAARHLVVVIRGLGESSRRNVGRIKPMADELQNEVAILGAETQHLSARMEAWRGRGRARTIRRA